MRADVARVIENKHGIHRALVRPDQRGQIGRAARRQNGIGIRIGLQLPEGSNCRGAHHRAVGFVCRHGIEHIIHKDRQRHCAAVRNAVLDRIVEIELLDTRPVYAEELRHFVNGNRGGQARAVGKRSELLRVVPQRGIKVLADGFVRKNGVGYKIYKVRRRYHGHFSVLRDEIEHAEEVIADGLRIGAQFGDGLAHVLGGHLLAERVGIAENIGNPLVLFQFGDDAVDFRFVLVAVNHRNGVLLREHIRQRVVVFLREDDLRIALQYKRSDKKRGKNGGHGVSRLIAEP